jgi:hypothetical protein
MMAAPAGWVFVGVNMRPDEAAALARLAEERGESKAATVRALLANATRHLADDGRGGHTCREDDFTRWGTSNPWLKPQDVCRVCWPTLPTVLERQDGERTAVHQMAFTPGGMRVPAWVHVHRRRTLHQGEQES